MNYFLKFILSLFILITVGCEIFSTQPDDDLGPFGKVVLSISYYPEVAPPAIDSTITIIVTGAGMDDATYEISGRSHSARDTLNVSPGSNRTFSMQIFDIDGDLCFSGETTIDVFEDSTVVLSKTLRPEPTRAIELPNGIDIEDIAVTTDGRIFAGTYGLGLYRTIDRGATWYRQDLLQERGMIKNIKISPAGNIFVSGSPGYYSTDDGNTWNVLVADDLFTADIAFSSDGGIYVGSGKSVYYSVDGGVTWTENSAESVMDKYSIRALAVDDVGSIFVGGSNGMRGRLFRYSPVDDQWSALETDMAHNEFRSLVNVNDGTLFASYNSHDESSGGIASSSDSGSTWHYYSEYHYYFPSGIKADSEGNIFASLIRGYWSNAEPVMPNGLYMYNTATEVWDIVFESKIWAMTIAANDDIYLMLDDGTMVSSTDDRATWQ